MIISQHSELPFEMSDFERIDTIYYQSFHFEFSVSEWLDPSSSMMPAVRGDAMRGLAVFISDIRNCKSKEAEVKRINKELANIRSKFKGDKTLDGYQKKKYVCKLLFIFLLGHDIDFGHMEAVNLLSSNKYTEKQIGYLFISVLISSNSDLINLINQSIKNDLAARNPVHVSLALQCIANVGSKVSGPLGSIHVELF